MVAFVPLTFISYIHFIRAGAVDSLSVALCVAVALTIQPVFDFIKTRGLKKHG
jgi:hypothetical protein